MSRCIWCMVDGIGYSKRWARDADCSQFTMAMCVHMHKHRVCTRWPARQRVRVCDGKRQQVVPRHPSVEPLQASQY